MPGIEPAAPTDYLSVRVYLASKATRSMGLAYIQLRNEYKLVSH